MVAVSFAPPAHAITLAQAAAITTVTVNVLDIGQTIRKVKAAAKKIRHPKRKAQPKVEH
jgi:RNase P/RNase MRP subunit POP5